jgi:hypothetical protein
MSLFLLFKEWNDNRESLVGLFFHDPKLQRANWLERKLACFKMTVIVKFFVC